MKLGVIGTGMIVPEFLSNCIEYKEIELESILSTKRSVEKAKEIANKFGIKNNYSEMEDFLASDIEIVYIGIPNSLHYEYGKKCLLAGKSVIMEKPFTSTYEEAKELIEIAKEKNLFIFEAISNQFLPNYKKVKELIKEIGDIKIVQLNFSQYSSRYDAFKKGEIAPVFNKEKGGGALVDLGVYNIYFIVGLFGSPMWVQYYPNIEKGVDTSGILIMEYDTFKCVCVNAKDCSAPLSINIQGDKGNINSTSAANSFDSFSLLPNKGEKAEYSLNGNKHRLYYEVGKFLEIYKNREYSTAEALNEKTLIVMDVLKKAKTVS